jgi:predicted DCC family thiol-disulfide oxidoreductase YuxK
MSAQHLTVYYDGLCPLCSREIAHFRARTPADAVTFVDFTEADFDPAAHGVDPERIRQVLHVRVGTEMCTGTEAFLALWSAVPGYGWLARLVRLPGIRILADASYWVFARVRPHLQRRQRRLCVTDSCRR